MSAPVLLTKHGSSTRLCTLLPTVFVPLASRREIQAFHRTRTENQNPRTEKPDPRTRKPGIQSREPRPFRRGARLARRCMCDGGGNLRFPLNSLASPGLPQLSGVHFPMGSDRCIGSPTSALPEPGRPLLHLDITCSHMPRPAWLSQDSQPLHLSTLERHRHSQRSSQPISPFMAWSVTRRWGSCLMHVAVALNIDKPCGLACRRV